jgi:hypothetical protein
MSDTNWARDIFVPPELLKRYLIATGWRRAQKDDKDGDAPVLPEAEAIRRALIEARGFGRRTFEIFLLGGGPDFPPMEIAAPTDPNSDNYNDQTSRILRTLSIIEDRDPNVVAGDIFSIGYDIIRSRIPDRYVYKNTISVRSAKNFIIFARDLIASTATHELQPNPFYLRMKKEAKEFSDQCRFGHTFSGSFGFTIEAPLTPNITPPLIKQLEQPPFERRVMQRLALGIRSLVEAAVRGDSREVVEQNQRGFGANACEYIVNLMHTTVGSGIVFDFSFSPEWPMVHDMPRLTSFELNAQHVEIARDAAKAMRKLQVARDATISGLVVRLASDRDPSNLEMPLGDREVFVRWLGEYGEVNVRVRLAPPDYLSAVDAHRNGMQVAMSGFLEQRGNRWHLLRPTKFAVL